MLENIEVFRQNSIKIKKDKTVYFDPYKIEEEYHDADIVFITHNHYDHFDKDSIINVMNDNTYIVVPNSLKDEVVELFKEDKVTTVSPLMEYLVNDVSFKTIPAYNINKQFHPKGNNWVGYVVKLGGYVYYVMGDTDSIEEAKSVKCDVLFIPIGGTYTMDYNEASELTNIIKPKVAIPVHYGSIVGSLSDGNNFISNLDEDIKGEIFIK